MALIPNPELPEEDWAKIGLACWGATSGGNIGAAIFGQWSAKAEKNVAAITAKRWRGFSRSPPNRIGYGTLQWHASQVSANWEEEILCPGPLQQQVAEFSVACGVAPVHENITDEDPIDKALWLAADCAACN